MLNELQSGGRCSGSLLGVFAVSGGAKSFEEAAVAERSSLSNHSGGGEAFSVGSLGCCPLRSTGAAFVVTLTSGVANRQSPGMRACALRFEGFSNKHPLQGQCTGATCGYLHSPSILVWLGLVFSTWLLQAGQMYLSGHL